MTKNNKIKKGFTLIELLMVVFIIGLLATIVTISISGAKSKSRDVKRISDINQLQIALDNYNKAEGQYPELLVPGESLIGSNTGIVFMSKLPENFSYYDLDCQAEGYEYSYDSINNTYEIAFCLENKVNNYVAGDKCAVPNKILEEICSFCDIYVSDIDGNIYNIIVIGDQYWLKENLKTTKYNDGTDIINATSSDDWLNNVTGAYSWYNNDRVTYESYGALYNWYAVSTTTNGNKNLCPIGWHVPTDAEWTELTRYVIGDPTCNPDTGCSPAGTYLKASSTNPIPWDGSDGFGFTALPAGYRHGPSVTSPGIFELLSLIGFFQSSSESSASNSWYRQIRLNYSEVFRLSYSKKGGFSVRCLKD